MSNPFDMALEDACRRGYVAAYRFLGNREESRDACQETAARVLSARDRYDPDQPFYPWFYRILKNHCLDRIKDRKRMKTCAEEPAPPRGEGADAGAETQVLEQERARAVNRAIFGLPEELRELIELRHFQDLGYEEMARILNCPVGTVMSRLYRARKLLREALLVDPDSGFESSPGRRG